MEKDSFQVISDRFLETAYGKSKEEILHLYQNDAQFKEDYDAVKQHLIDVLEPIVKEVYEAARKVIEPVVQSITELVQSNPEYFKALQNNMNQSMFQSASMQVDTMKKTITLKIKMRFPFYWYLFKVKFQSLYNKELAEDTFEWFMCDFEENQNKYIKVNQSRQPIR